MQLQIYLEPRTVCGCSFDVVNRGERSKGGGTAPPRLWRRISPPILSSLVKKESGPRRAVAGLSGRYWFVEICMLGFKAWRSQELCCACALGVSPMHRGAFGAQHRKGVQCSLSAKPLCAAWVRLSQTLRVWSLTQVTALPRQLPFQGSHGLVRCTGCTMALRCLVPKGAARVRCGLRGQLSLLLPRLRNSRLMHQRPARPTRV